MAVEAQGAPAHKTAPKQLTTGDNGALGMLDFSLALHRSNLATALVYNNPIEEKMLQDKVTCLDKMRRRHLNQRYIEQRRFFVTQVFEKGLTPYVPAIPTGEGKPADSVLITDPVESVGEPSGRRTASKRGESLPYGRSKTICDIQLKHAGNKTTNDQTVEKTTTVNMFQEHRSMTRDVLGEAATTEKRPRRLKPVRRDIRTLKKDPSMLFPRMNTLIFEGYESHHLHRRKQQDYREQFQDESDETLKDRAMLHTGKGDQLSKQIKLVQKLTSSLPDHLMASAKKQIRQMSNSDAIYECKDKLLKENKGELRRQVGFDPRWRHLEGSLSTTHGIGLKWEKSIMDGSWIVLEE